MSGEDNSRLWWSVETWLRYGNVMRRPLTRSLIPLEAFEAQRRPNVEYVIYERIEGTYSNGHAGRPEWQRV